MLLFFVGGNVVLFLLFFGSGITLSVCSHFDVLFEYLC